VSRADAAPRGPIAISSRPVAIALLAGWTAMVWGLCTADRIPHVPRYVWTPWVFNLGHAPLFGGWAALLAVSLRPGVCPGPAEARASGAAAPGRLANTAPDDDAWRDHRIWWAVALAGVVFGTLVEWRQAAIPGRTASALDVVTDAVGAFGVPWALATGALFTRRALAVFCAAGLAALVATYA